jgi:hypothetical protein
MTTSVTLEADEFRDLHNALCELRSYRAERQRTGKTLDQIIDRMERSLAGAYRQEDEDFQRKHTHYEIVGRDLNLVSSIWSLMEVTDLTQPHVWPSATHVIYDRHWGTPVTVEIQGKSWADLWKAADQAILLSGDRHHVYVEHFQPTDRNGYLALTTGS